MEYRIKEVLSNGFSLGNIKKEIEIKDNIKILSKEKEKELFSNSVLKSLNEINLLKEKEKDLYEYLCVQELMINDPLLKKSVFELIDEGKSAKDAISISMDYVIDNLALSNSNYLKERVEDIKDVVSRLIMNLSNKKNKEKKKPFILYTNNLKPSYIINNHENILGVIAKNGGITSHSTIICKNYNIPYVIADIEFKEDDLCYIDTRKNIIIINPSLDIMEEYIKEKNEETKYMMKAIDHKGYKFLANVQSNNDLKYVLEYDFDGVGLYRTEFIFMNSNRAYTFLEQYEIYKEAITLMDKKSICFRTFDIGDDKEISYLKANKKGIDNYINNKELFETQIKALLEANIHDNISIMFPMIESNYEFNYLRDWLIDIAKKYNYKIPRIGMMLETKLALENINEFKNVDFISIGTNDLTFELYNIEREKVKEIDNIKILDDLLNKIKIVIDYCNKYNIELSICGEIAGIKDIALKLYEIGIKALSVSPSNIKSLNQSYTEFINK